MPSLSRRDAVVDTASARTSHVKVNQVTKREPDGRILTFPTPPLIGAFRYPQPESKQHRPIQQVLPPDPAGEQNAPSVYEAKLLHTRALCALFRDNEGAIGRIEHSVSIELSRAASSAQAISFLGRELHLRQFD
jgi:hypothetical protein